MTCLRSFAISQTPVYTAGRWTWERCSWLKDGSDLVSEMMIKIELSIVW